MDWNRFIVKNSATAVEDDSTTKWYSFVKPQFLGESATAEQVLFAAPAGLADGSRFVSLQQHGPIVEKVSSQESATETLLAAAPDAVQAFFQRAESQLSARTEITAQYALKLLRRIRVLVVEICPSNIQGRVLALVDGEDGSATIEWICNRSRLGFVLDREHESSWFVVLPNGLSRSGYLYGNAGLKSLRGLLEEFVAAGE
jgi:hypothetical protein